MIRPPKAGYYTKPEFHVLQRLSNLGLSEVRDFTIGNEHGFIKFEGRTDLVGVDLAADVTISPREAEVYPDETRKPPFGEKLNKRLTITLLGMAPRKSSISINDYVKRLKSKIEPHGGEHVFYCSQSHTWEFRVYFD